jgi:hypothetical protein
MTSNDSAIVSWNNATIQLNRYFPIFIFLFGIIGNILNILVLSQRTLRPNPCAFLFLASSVASLVAIISGLFSRATSGWTVDLTNTITWLCQLRNFIVSVSRTIAYCLLALATIDRWLLSCSDVHRRQLSTLKNAHRGMIIISICSCLLYVQEFYCYEANLLNTPLECYGKTMACQLISDLTYAFAANIFPLIIMIYFGFVTIINVRRAHRQVRTMNIATVPGAMVNSQRRLKKTDHYLRIMLFGQVVLFGLFNLPQNIEKFISLAQSNKIISPLDNAIDNFIFDFFLLFAYLANGMSFYIYTLFGGSIFRNELLKLVQKVCIVTHLFNK